ncbi:MAG: S41 family peptidase [Bacteroides sp.]|nr:S41 family peptidase [Ruminococcus flavefaciens]MCM1554176.1 S41 family peptidase [Bacteroides sp.]
MKKTLHTLTLFLMFALVLPAQTGKNRKAEPEAEELPRNHVSLVENKMGTLLQMIRYAYVEDVDMSPIVEKGIVNILEQLDPHSAYIAAKDLKRTNEPLVGNFDGIGVSFQIFEDSVMVVDVISGGPAQKVGVLPGDRIVRIDTLDATGKNANTNFVFTHLRGKKGTRVEVGIRRKGDPETMVFEIERDKIPLHSVDTYFMIDKRNGYIQLDRFSRTSAEEVAAALADLKKQGMKNLILDLRGNTGGYLDIAVSLADQFLPKDRLVVYMQGKAQEREEFRTTGKGQFIEGRMVVMIDENSASASEILAGALQDWDRVIVVGRRSFGKGLVQRPFNLPDHSNVRLTIARYYTPSGRCIQKPYKDGMEAYYKDIMNRYRHGEMVHPDSVKMPDSLRYYTAGNRLVYGGGGIMPDVFVPADTTRASDYYVALRSKNLLNRYVLSVLDKGRDAYKARYPDFKTFYENFEADSAFMQGFYGYAAQKGVPHTNFKEAQASRFLQDLLKEMQADTTLKKAQTYTEYMQNVLWDEARINAYLHEKAQKEDENQRHYNDNSDRFLRAQIKALFASNLYGTPYFYRVTKEVDDAFSTAVRVLNDKALFDKMGIHDR